MDESVTCVWRPPWENGFHTGRERGGHPGFNGRRVPPNLGAHTKSAPFFAMDPMDPAACACHRKQRGLLVERDQESRSRIQVRQ